MTAPETGGMSQTPEAVELRGIGCYEAESAPRQMER